MVSFNLFSPLCDYICINASSNWFLGWWAVCQHPYFYGIDFMEIHSVCNTISHKEYKENIRVCVRASYLTIYTCITNDINVLHYITLHRRHIQDFPRRGRLKLFSLIVLQKGEYEKKKDYCYSNLELNWSQKFI